MTIRIGTIHEITGQGLEILVDAETRSILLGKFFDGNLIAGPSRSGETDAETVIAE